MKKVEFKPTGRRCPLCDNPTVYEQMDVGHKEEGCQQCDVCGDEIFAFARRVIEKHGL